MDTIAKSLYPQALVYSASRMGHKVEHLRSIFVSTYGILFLATPHDGSDKARLGSYLQKIVDSCLPNKLIDTSGQLVDSLDPGSEVLQEITDNFVPLMSRFCLFFFWEQEKTSLKWTNDYVCLQPCLFPALLSRDADRFVFRLSSRVLQPR